MKAFERGPVERMSAWLVPLIITVAVAILLVLCFHIGGSSSYAAQLSQPVSLSIVDANITSNTTITVYLKNSGSQNETIGIAYVDATPVDIFDSSDGLITSLTLAPGSGADLTLNNYAADWDNGASHMVRFIADNGDSATYTIPASSVP